MPYEEKCENTLTYACTRTSMRAKVRKSEYSSEKTNIKPY